jgi:hypothetical protein
MKLNSPIYLLTLLSTSHILFIVSHFIFILGYDNFISNYMTYGIVLSFLIFKKCILIDIYNYILDMFDLKYDSIPIYAKDSILRNTLKLLKSMISGKKLTHSKDYTKYRLDILNNVKPFTNSTENPTELYNHKVQYLTANIVLTVMILYKLNINQFVIFLIIWLTLQFPL